MSKFIVINTSNGIVASTHGTQELADKAARKLNGSAFIVETKITARKGDVWADVNPYIDDDDTESFEAEQELAECDESLDLYEDFNDEPATPAQIALAEKEVDEFIATQETITYIAKPQDSRCSWWCVQVPQKQQLDGTRISAPFLKRGADLELKAGDMLINSEAIHHRKNHGYSVVLIVCDGGKIQHLHPMAQRKAFIKAHGGQDLMHESGDVNGCIRMAVWLRRQPDFKAAVSQLLEC